MGNPAEEDKELDVVDEENRVTGREPRWKVHSLNLMHRASHVFLFNSRGELFIQKRGADKETQPLKYDSSAAGHLKPGESYGDCATRELKEELGIEAPLEEIGAIGACRELGWEHATLYRCVTDQPPAINPDEIEDGFFKSLPELKAMIQEDEEAFTTDFVHLFNRSLKTR